MTDLGTLRADGQRRSVRFERVYAATPDEVWAALTDPDLLRGWLGEAQAFEARVGGRVHLQLGSDEEQVASGTVLACDPPRVLEYEWHWPGQTDSIVRFELKPADGGTTLVLDHRLLPANAATGYGAGWHAYLDRLELSFAGESRDWQERFDEMLPRYRDQAAGL